MSSNITSAWLASPANSANVGAGNEEMQDIKDTFRVRIAREHELSLTEASPQTLHGAHKPGSAVPYVQSSAPTLRPDGVTALGEDDHGRLWIDTDTLKIYFWNWSGSSGAWTEVSPAHGLVLLTSGSSWTATHTGPVKVTCVGGGGGGGGCVGSTSFNSHGGGGGGGASGSRVYDVVLGTAYTYAIGAAGAAGTSSPTSGGNGGNTTFTDGVTLLTAGGGIGGPYRSGSSYGSETGAGGSATGGTINIPGGNGEGRSNAGYAVAYAKGGDSAFGNGGSGAAGAAVNATGYGGGGYGALAVSATGVAGGAGTAGCILIEW